MTICSCWVPYPNEAHKLKNGRWKCVDYYKCVRDYDGKRKTQCVKMTIAEIIDGIPDDPKNSSDFWEPDNGSLICPLCGCVVYPMEIEYGNFNYCPNCGKTLKEREVKEYE